jgi:hypothetical protein
MSSINAFTAWGILRFRMEESRHLWRVEENISNKRVYTIDMGGDTPATGLSTRQKSALKSVTKDHGLAGMRRETVDMLMKLPVP